MKNYVSIKFKWTAFIVLMLMLNLIMISFFTLGGILKNQKRNYEEILLEKSKATNLYIREQYLLSYSLNKEDEKETLEFKEFFKSNIYDISTNIEKILGLNINIYDLKGEILYERERTELNFDYKKMLDRAIKDEIIYKKEKSNIIYFAPIYDYENQIAVLSFSYSIKADIDLYDDVKNIFYKSGFISLIVISLLGIFYFSKSANKIVKLKRDIKKIENGEYGNIEVIKSRDEIEELSKGISYAAQKIQTEVSNLNEEKKKLEMAIVKLKKLEKQQKAFIGDITHEFKTPLTIIKTQIDLITLYKDDEDMISKAKIIAEKEIKRLDEMVLKTLEISKLDRYKLENKIENLDIRDILLDVCSRIEAKANKFDIDINVDVESESCKFDKEHMTKVFINLLDNAIKYNEVGGSIFVRGFKLKNSYIVEVEDTGIGIDEKHRENIFKPFYVVDENRAKKFSGTGLGLALVKKLVIAQGGTVECVEGNKGTCFKIKLNCI